ncbi:MAG TPA: glycoside hydrolase domain-containing protein [Acidobacteriaceae bacterium]|nr:glycoside hydrolase domain-containing protein [Acidobacteriaceae bacterium]
MTAADAARRFWAAALVALCAAGFVAGAAQTTKPTALRSYCGFDKDGYPGDALLPLLHRTFAFTGFWLNDPPGMTTNPWAGKRAIVRAAGFGFLILFNGRLDKELTHRDAAALGRADGTEAVAAALREGFPAGAVIFLDQEEGGALLDEQASYLGRWLAAVNASAYRAGVYASGISVPAGRVRMSTAQDVEARFPGVQLWVWDDRCPRSPGCVAPDASLSFARSGFPQAVVWQYAQSPRRRKDTAACRRTYAADGRCYAPGLPHSEATHIDLDVSSSADPSHGR